MISCMNETDKPRKNSTASNETNVMKVMKMHDQNGRVYFTSTEAPRYCP